MNTNENNNKTKDSNLSTNENQKRKDPKSMSLEELEAILSKTKLKMKNEIKDDNASNKGLNNSQFSQKNYSFYEQQKYKPQDNDQAPLQNSNYLNNNMFNQNPNENISERSMLINPLFSSNFKLNEKNITTPKEVFNMSLFSEPVSDNEERVTRNNLKAINENLHGNINNNQSAGRNYLFSCDECHESNAREN